MSASRASHKEKRAVTSDPDIQALLARLPEDMVVQMSEQHLRYLRTALGSGKWRKHPIDVRGTLPIPFLPSRIYFVFLMGRNRREISRRERHISWATSLLLMLFFMVFCTLVGVLSLYLLKSALGIDLIPTSSTGIWDWFRELFS